MRVEAAREVRGSYSATGTGPGNARSELVVVAAANAQQAEALRRALRMAGPSWQVEATTDPYQAGLLVGERRPAVLLLDASLAGVDAWALCRRVTSRPADQRPSVIMVGRNASRAEREQALASGACAYLSAPVRAGALRSLLTRIRQTSNPSAGSLEE